MDWLRSGDAPRPGSPQEAVALVAKAREQRVAPLLHVAVEGTGEEWPEPARQELREAYHEAFSNGVVQLELAARAQKLLEDAGLRSLPLKGAAVAELLYDSVAERAMADVDLLALDDWRASVETLKGAGFREQLRADHAVSFADPVTSGSLELHHSLCSCPGLFRVDPDALWRRSVSGSGQVRRRPCNADLLVQLSLHAAFQNGLVLTLGQYLDFRRLLERDPPEGELLTDVARRSRAEGAVIAALEAARATTGCPGFSEEGALRAGLSRGLESWLRERVSEPRGLLGSAARPLGRARWELTRGRRIALLLATVAPREPGEPAISRRRLAQALGRARRLIRYWVPASLRAWRGPRT